MNDESTHINQSDQPKQSPSALGRVTVPAVASIVAVLFFFITSPQSLPSVLLIAGFIMLGVLLYSVLNGFLRLTGLAVRLSRTYRRAVLVIGTILPVLLIMLQSIGQLTVRDVLTLGGLFLLGAFYVNRLFAK